MNHPEPSVICPYCGVPSPHQTPRYPQAVCAPCTGRLTDAGGRSVEGYNLSHTGGFVALHKDDGSRCESSTADGWVLIDGRPYRAGEARFGGVVVQPLAG